MSPQTFETNSENLIPLLGVGRGIYRLLSLCSRLTLGNYAFILGVYALTMTTDRDNKRNSHNNIYYLSHGLGFLSSHPLIVFYLKSWWRL